MQWLSIYFVLQSQCLDLNWLNFASNKEQMLQHFLYNLLIILKNLVLIMIMFIKILQKLNVWQVSDTWLKKVLMNRIKCIFILITQLEFSH